MFENKKVCCNQNYGEKERQVNFEPDSSPCAWEHYINVYGARKSKIIEQYNFNALFFYYYNNDGNNIYYSNQIKSEKNRLFAMHNGTEYFIKNDVKCCKPARRLGGECDFNFNNDKEKGEYNKYKIFCDIIKNDGAASSQEKERAIEQLKRCKEMHHTLLNFSLIEGMGDMQGFKGTNRFDRLDAFVCKLDRYFSGLSNDVIFAASGPNKNYLISYLNSFTDIYDYCNEIYFIDDKDFIDKIIEEGQMPIETCKDVVRYMNLAEEFWARKKLSFDKLCSKTYICPKCGNEFPLGDYSIPPFCENCDD